MFCNKRSSPTIHDRSPNCDRPGVRIYAGFSNDNDNGRWKAEGSGCKVALLKAIVEVKQHNTSGKSYKFYMHEGLMKEGTHDVTTF